MGRADPTITQPTLGPVGWLRWIWRQLTSMRTALLLLLLLAVAAVPGSIWPQRSVDPPRVTQYLREHPDLGPWLDRLGLFDVYASPWFAAIYLLLMVSLVGCLVPRTKAHWRALRTPPPAVPRRLERLPAHRHTVLDADPDQVLAAARSVLRGHRARLRTTAPGERGLSAERGYLKESGNLLFHVALLGVIVSVAVGGLWGWRAEVILPEGRDFASDVATYDTMRPGPWVDLDALEPFTMRIEDLNVEFETEATGAQFGAPRLFEAQVSVAAAPGEPEQVQRLAVNDPLHLDGTSVFLLGNGYAPEVTVRDAGGTIVYRDAVPFLPQDDNYTSTGAIKVAGADPELGLYGAFLPTARFDADRGPTSDFPGLADPQLALGIYEGDLFPDGAAQSVYTLDVSGMEPVTDASGSQVQLLLSPGETEQLPDGRGSVTLDGVSRWGGLVVRHDPGRLAVLVFAVGALIGLTLMLAVRRQRLFVRVTDEDQGDGRHTGVSVAGLAKDTDPRLEELVDRIAEQIRDRVEPTATKGKR
ncbi:MAG: cytochrome c biogenesis protein ResB [Ornithinimicrobium sp.]|uniref:cytochrome c biogenesis protein ResB n=1 Tax=Ornithinimicrobium sp. TaxID=1977084 RepID=UPI003D9BBD6D